MKIKSDICELTFSLEGAQITSFYNKETGLQYMWQGDPNYWSGKNPILFPIIGNTYTGKYTIDNKEYSLPKNGLLRYATFDLVSENDDSIEFKYSSNQDTLKQYPYEFDFLVKYTIVNNRLYADFTVINKNNCDMPFSFGWHPAFNCPINKDKKFEDYHVELDSPEILHRINCFTNEINDLQEPTMILPLKYETFEKEHAMFFVDTKSKRVKLTDNEHGISISIDGYKWFTCWTKPNAPFLCIEPWTSKSDIVENNYTFFDRPGTTVLKAHDVYHKQCDVIVF